MSKTKIKKAWEAELIGKIRSMIEHMYPGSEEELREVYVYENEDKMKITKRKSDFRLGFHAWFLLKHEFPSGATAMEMTNSLPMDYFNEKEKKMIKNFLNYKESLFEILKISNDKKDYTIKDLADKKVYVVKTIDLPEGFKEKEFIQVIIVKNMEGNHFFYGTVMSFDIWNKKEFVNEILNEFKIENKIRKEREKEEIEWEIQK